MTRENFKKIIKLRSVWEIDKRKGNYVLPNGDKLSNYVRSLIESQMKIDNLGIREDGNLAFWNDSTDELMPAFEENEHTDREIQYDRVTALIKEMIY